jgi:hypothetical protein
MYASVLSNWRILLFDMKRSFRDSANRQGGDTYLVHMMFALKCGNVSLSAEERHAVSSEIRFVGREKIIRSWAQMGDIK